ncbi:MAG: LysR family transcriptional regulator, partial [Deltaproteobacteria bacterium]|nr:LysR family transcriptional regulator [Deltaproteobacteria bacterium]
MDLEWLESFRVFSETLNFTHAAKQRHLTQPAVFRHIQNLSEDVGVPLYRKVGRNLLLTNAGRRLAGFAREMPDRLAVMYSDVRRDGDEPTVSLSAGQGAFLYLLGPAIRRFMRRKISKLRLAVRDGASSLSDVRDGTAHLAVTVVRTPLPDL